MADRPVVFEGANLGLVVILTVLCLALGILFVGPGRTALADARQGVQELDVRQSEWDDRYGNHVEYTDADRRAWQSGYAQMSRFGPPTAEEPGLTAWVASQLRAPSVRGLEVRRHDESKEEDETGGLRLHSPAGDEEVLLREISVNVRFYALYEDVVRVLSRIEAENSAMKIARIQLQRNAPEVRVELDLALWSRTGDAS